jgi:Carboxypeptidase regulatory-like domain
MRPLVAGVLATALALALFGVSYAQTAPPSETLVARCDLPVVDLFNPMPGDVLQPGSYLISGLALDPMAPQNTSGIDQVAFYLGDRDQGGMSLGTVVPSSGLRQADFSMEVTLPTGNVGQTSELEAFARSALTGKETELALPVVLGRNPTPATAANAAANTINTNPGTLPDTCSQGDALSPLTANPAPTPSPVSVMPAPKVSSNATLFGTIVGSVTTCQGGIEQPVTLVTVQVAGTSATATTDLDGTFQIAQVPAPGTYTVTVTAGGQTASRMYVPVAPGESIDIGVLEVGGDLLTECGEGLPPTT